MDADPGLLFSSRMLSRLRFILSLLGLTSVLAAADKAKNCGCECCKGEKVCCCVTEEAAAHAEKEKTPRYPLRGVIVGIDAEKATLTVKHEAIPGVMPAMTMLFRVDDATARTAKKGQTIAAQMSRRDEDWWLHEVRAVGANE